VKSAKDFERFTGMEVDLKLRVAVGNRKNFRGVLQGLLSGELDSPDAKFGLVFEAADGQPSQLEFSLAEVDKTRLVPVIDFKGRKS
jgi:ribosome maturation factor RimP